MHTVWGITRGSYSDYRVLAIFATKKDAEAAKSAALGAGDDVWSAADSVESFTFYDKDETPNIVTEFSRIAEVGDDSTVSNERSMVRREWEYAPLYETPKARPNVRFVRAPIHRGKGGRLEVRGSDERAVNQAYSDNLAILRAVALATGKAALTAPSR